MNTNSYKNGERIYIVYDERAANGNTEEATVLESFSTRSDTAAIYTAYRDWAHLPFVLYGCTFKDGVAIEDEAPLKKHWC